MFVSRRLLSYTRLNNQATEWLQTKWGRRARIGLLVGTIVGYPVGSLLVNGPLVSWTFPKRYAVTELPDYLVSLAKQEYERFLEKESRVAKDASASYYLSTDLSQYDSVAAGSLGVRSGLHVAVPLFCAFRSVDESLTYFKEKYPNGFQYLGEHVNVDWNSESGRELASTFVLTEDALKFLFLRDHFAHDGYAALAQRSISWTSWTSFSGIFTYWLHQNAKIFGGTAATFVVVYTLFGSAAWFANRHWHYLYRYITDVYADSVSAKSTSNHSNGGRELYWKQLKRNRLIRDISPTLYTKIKASGDIRGIPTSILVRYDHLKDVSEDDEELKEVIVGDD